MPRASAAAHPDDLAGLHPGRGALAISSGAGSGSQNAIGTGVIGGMLTATFLAIFFVPTFFVVMLKLFKVKRMSEQRDKHETDVAAEGPAQ